MYLRQSGSRVLLALSVTCLPATALAVPYTLDFGTLQFASTGQSMWGPGQSTQLDQSLFLGTSWGVTSPMIGTIVGGVSNVTVPVPHLHLPSGWECHGFLCSGGHFHDPGGIHIHHVDLGDIDTRTGAEAEISTSGRVGFNFGVQMDSGSVNTQVDIAARVLVPGDGDVAAGEYFNLNPESMLAGGQLATNFPEISARMEAVLNLQANIFGQACVIGFGCAQGSEDLININQTIELLSFNDTDSPGQIRILNQLDPALFQFGEEINIPSAIPGGSFGGVTVNVPDINTLGGVSGNMLTSSGGDDLLRMTLDLDGLALAPLGLPGLGASLDVGMFSVSADLIDVDMGPIITVQQRFEFTPTLWVDLLFDNPVYIAGHASPVTSWSSAWASLPDIALLAQETLITPTFSLRGLFNNQTFLGIDGIFQVDVLRASLALEAFGLSLGLGQLGPLFQILERTNLFNTPPLFSNSYALGGFQSIQGTSFAMSTRVPEPATISLFGIGLLGIALMSRRRKLLAA